MNDRTEEKLVELLQHENNPVWKWFPNNATMAQLADYLINSGVTVQEDCKECAEATQNCIVKLQEQIAELRSAQEWVSVTERLPEEEGLYLVAVVNDHERRYSKTAWYHGHGNWFLHQKVTNWMPLPEPPKEE